MRSHTTTATLSLSLLAGAACGQTCLPHWEPVGAAAGLDAGVNAMAVLSTGQGLGLYLGGDFEHAGGQLIKRVARWDPGAPGPWSPLGSGIEAFTHSIFGCCAHVYCLDTAAIQGRSALFVGGDFIVAGGLTAESIAWWSANGWSDLAGGLLNTSCRNDCGPRVHDIASIPVPFDYHVYLAGTFTDSFNGRPISRVARWNGSDFIPLGTGIEEAPGDPFPFWAEGLAFFNDGGGQDLYVCGRFGRAGGVAVRDIARWDGQAWSDVGGGLSSSIPGRVTAAKAMAVFSDGSGPLALYIAGEFDRAGGVTVSNIARWDGQAWSDVGEGTDQQILTLYVHDDGSGLALFAGGQFTSAGGQAADHVAKWDGQRWHALGAGVDGDVQCFQTFNDGGGEALFVGGWFQNAGGQFSPHFAKWVGCLEECYADCDTSTGRFVLDIFDFLCFQNRYDQGSPYACDCDTTTGPGVCDIFDFLCFQNAYDAGCP